MLNTGNTSPKRKRVNPRNSFIRLRFGRVLRNHMPLLS